MNREIKFRAWDSKNKIMHVQGDTVDENRSMFWKMWETTSHISEPMEYVGLNDKNGEDIYEEDWCKAKFRTATKVWEIEGRIFMDEYMWCIECADDTYSINRIHDVEVITNIYENPDLLTKK